MPGPSIPPAHTRRAPAGSAPQPLPGRLSPCALHRSLYSANPSSWKQGFQNSSKRAHGERLQLWVRNPAITAKWLETSEARASSSSNIILSNFIRSVLGENYHLWRNPSFLLNQFSKVSFPVSEMLPNTLMLMMYFWILLLPSPCDPFVEPAMYDVSTPDWAIHSIPVSGTVTGLVHFLHKNKSMLFSFKNKDDKSSGIATGLLTSYAIINQKM